MATNHHLPGYYTDISYVIKELQKISTKMYPMGYIFVIKYGVIRWITMHSLDLSWFGQGNYYIYPHLYSSSVCGLVSLAFTTLKNLHQKSDNSPKILMKSTKNYINYDLFSGELCSQDCCWRWKLCLRKLKKCITW